jgi:hypothetical protein
LPFDHTSTEAHVIALGAVDERTLVLALEQGVAGVEIGKPDAPVARRQ